MIYPFPTVLPSTSLSGTYYRAVNTKFITTAISTAHTPTVVSRYSDGKHGYKLLYLAEDHLTALCEVNAMLGVPWSPGSLIPSPFGSWTVVPVNVGLRKVLDLTDATTQTALKTNYQEVTGDWQGYTLRPLYNSTVFGTGTGAAPTQDLGKHLKRNGFDGVLTASAKVPYKRNVVISPDNLRGSGGSYEYIDPITNLPVTVTS